MEPTKAPSFWGKIWNERDVQIMVLFSLALQLFLLFVGQRRRGRRLSGWVRFLLWLAYLAAYAVAASAIGLFSQYEDKYKLRSLESFEHLHTLTMPFLWAPFLLLHLGGPDSITAFSVEDNNLWTRQLINLAFQLGLALYVFWKSLDLLDWQLLIVAVPLFVAGTIKYGERILALRGGSRDSLDSRQKEKKEDRVRNDSPPLSGDVVASYALGSVLRGKGLLVGRTLSQLGDGFKRKLMEGFAEAEGTEEKLKIILMELGMIYDLLYTKTMVLQSWTGVFRLVALVAMVVAFVLFWVNQHLHAHRTTNAAITYTLFVAAISVEVYSIFMAIASPWTRARTRFGKTLCWLSSKASSLSRQGLSSPSMGQFNLTDYSVSRKYTPKFIDNVSQALGLEKHWRNFWYVKHVDDKVIMDYIVGMFTDDTDGLYPWVHHQLDRGQLTDLLCLPFEHALFVIHIFTDLQLCTFDSDDSDMKVLAEECRKLSNYLMYLMVVYPSMLPVSNAARDHEPLFVEWVRDNHGNKTKAEILVKYARECIEAGEIVIKSPFIEPLSVALLKEMKELWVRLLIYAAGKCRMEQHARHLSEGVEFLTLVGSLMMHLGLGDAGKELGLLPPNDTFTWETQLERGAIQMMLPRGRPLYAFEYTEEGP